jgi:hypothetical protein
MMLMIQNAIATYMKEAQFVVSGCFTAMPANREADE